MAGTHNESPSGFVDDYDVTHVAGWAIDPARVDDSIDVEIRVGDRVLGVTRADSFRGDLEIALGSGRHGFAFHFANPISATELGDLVIAVRQTGRTLAFWKRRELAHGAIPAEVYDW